MNRVAVFGDLSGHLTPFIRTLNSLGVEFNPVFIPEDLTIVQVGDLVHKGKESNQAVILVDSILESKFNSQWVQLFGNHEMQHIPGGKDFWKCDCHPETIDILNKWWSNAQAHIAAGIMGGHNKYLPRMDTLITHAGLTFPFLDQLLLAQDARTATEKLNLMQSQNDYRLSHSGIMLGGASDPYAGPIWALSVGEVYETWVDNQFDEIISSRLPRVDHLGTQLFSTEMPFNQVHGHSYPFDWESKSWFEGVTRVFRDEINLYHKNRFSRFRPNIQSGAILGIDPGFNKNDPTVDNQPFLLLSDVVDVITD